MYQTEFDSRKSSGIFKSTFGKLDRGINRAFYSSDIRDDIITNLTLINGYFMIMKSQYDMTLELYQREFEDDWAKIWKIIENSEEFNDYMIPKTIKDSTKEILKNEEDTMKEAATEFKDAIIDSNEIDIKTNSSTK